MACLILARSWAAELVKVWQVTTNQIGDTSAILLLGVAPDGASLIVGSKLFWIVEGKIVWSGPGNPSSYPLLLNRSNLVYTARPNADDLESSVRWLRRNNDFVGEKIIGLSTDEPIVRTGGILDLANRFLPSEQIPHFLTRSTLDKTLTCWRLDDPDIWPPPAITASPAAGSEVVAKVVNHSGLPIDLQRSTNLGDWASFRRISALPSTNLVTIPTDEERQQFLRAITAGGQSTSSPSSSPASGK